MTFCAGLVLVALSGGAAAASETDHEAIGDAAWAKRAVGIESGHGNQAAVREAIRAYRVALALDPHQLPLRVKLLGALFYYAEHTQEHPSQDETTFTEGKEVFEEGKRLLEKKFARDFSSMPPREVAELLSNTESAGEFYFYGGLHWGLWGSYFGNFSGLRKGVAKKIRDYGQVSIELAPNFDRGGPYRLVGRLHALAPKVPFVTGWINRAEALTLLEKALASDPRDPLNQTFLAEALLEFSHPDHQRAIQLLELAASAQPRTGLEVEDTQASQRARRVLRDLER